MPVSWLFKLGEQRRLGRNCDAKHRKHRETQPAKPQAPGQATGPWSSHRLGAKPQALALDL